MNKTTASYKHLAGQHDQKKHGYRGTQGIEERARDKSEQARTQSAMASNLSDFLATQHNVKMGAWDKEPAKAFDSISNAFKNVSDAHKFMSIAKDARKNKTGDYVSVIADNMKTAHLRINKAKQFITDAENSYNKYMMHVDSKGTRKDPSYTGAVDIAMRSLNHEMRKLGIIPRATKAPKGWPVPIKYSFAQSFINKNLPKVSAFTPGKYKRNPAMHPLIYPTSEYLGLKELVSSNIHQVIHKHARRKVNSENGKL